MQKVAVLTDSIACLSPEMAGQFAISVVPLSFYFGGKIYRDWVDITPSEAYELFLKDPESFKASTVTPFEYLKAYREISKRTSQIVCVTVSSGISACCSAALEAKRQARIELPGVDIDVIDSQTVAAAEGFITLAAAKAADGGAPAVEVAEIASDMRDRVSFFIFLETIRHVYRSGRIPKIASQAGSILNVKPVLTISSGVLHMVGVARSLQSGIGHLLRAMRNRLGTRPAHIAVTHAYAPLQAENLREQIASEFNCTELRVSEFSPLMGYACGTGALGVAFYPD